MDEFSILMEALTKVTLKKDFFMEKVFTRLHWGLFRLVSLEKVLCKEKGKRFLHKVFLIKENLEMGKKMEWVFCC